MSQYLTAALYKFVTLDDYQELQQPILETCQKHQIKGTLLLAHEGINGTIAGKPEDIRAVLAYLRQDPRLADLEHRHDHDLDLDGPGDLDRCRCGNDSRGWGGRTGAGGQRDDGGETGGQQCAAAAGRVQQEK